MFICFGSYIQHMIQINIQILQNTWHTIYYIQIECKQVQDLLTSQPHTLLHDINHYNVNEDIQERNWIYGDKVILNAALDKVVCSDELRSNGIITKLVVTPA